MSKYGIEFEDLFFTANVDNIATLIKKELYQQYGNHYGFSLEIYFIHGGSITIQRGRKEERDQIYNDLKAIIQKEKI
ncbi:MAG: hypothetical protein ABFC98_05815 [Candidatus Cloacimonas sp.]